MSKTSPKKPPQRRLSESEKTEAFENWESGQWKLRELSEKFGISENALSRLFKRNNIDKGAKKAQYDEMAAAKARKETEERLSQRVTRAESMTDLTLAALDASTRAQIQLFKQAQSGGQSLSSHEKAIKTHGVLCRNIRDNVAVARELAGLNVEVVDSDEELPEIVVREMTEEDVRKIRDQQEREEEMISGGESLNPEDLDEIGDGGEEN